MSVSFPAPKTKRCSPDAELEVTSSSHALNNVKTAPMTLLPWMEAWNPETKHLSATTLFVSRRSLCLCLLKKLRMADYAKSQSPYGVPASKSSSQMHGHNHNSGTTITAGSSRPAESKMRSENNLFSQTREYGLLFFEPAPKPRIRLPPLSGLDDSTIRRLYSPAVVMLNSHPELVDLVGSTVVSFLESLSGSKTVY
jgi:hypothetical protein